MSLRVLHLNSGPISGGAAKGCERLHNGLRAAGVDSIMVTETHSGLDCKVGVVSISLFARFFLKPLNRVFHRLVLKLSTVSGNMYTGPYELTNTFKANIARIKPDIIHIHWTSRSISLSQILDLASSSNVIVTMRDMWWFTGGCHYSGRCDGYIKGCHDCPMHAHDKYNLLETSTTLKSRASKNIKFIAISNWLKGEANRSIALDNCEITTIYNSIDTLVFNNMERDRFLILDRYQIETDRKVVLVGGSSIVNGYKGFQQTNSYIRQLAQSFFVIVFGEGSEAYLGLLSQEHSRVVGFISETELADLYFAADLFVMTSTQEAFGKTVIEALACGTPVLAYSNTAPAEIIKLVCGDQSLSLDDPFCVEQVAVYMDNFDPTAAALFVAENFSNAAIAAAYKAEYSRMTPKK